MPHRKKIVHILSVVLIVMITLACSLFTRTQEIPTSDPYIFPEVTTPLKIEPESLPNAQTGVEYEIEIRVSDNVTPVSSVFISDGVFPAGLELVFVDDEDSITISGAPEETGTFTFTVFISCVGTMVAGQTGEKEYTIVVE